MALTSSMIRQRDFSGGELGENMKRRDDAEQTRASGRKMRNWRIEASGNIVDRPGHTALFPQAGRTQTILMPGDVRFRLSFGAGSISIRDAAGSVVSYAAGYPWTLSTVGRISFAVINRDILICYPGSVPQVIRRNTATGVWTFFAFTFATGYQGEIKAPFYRFPETLGITILPSARSGSITLTASVALFAAGMVGTTIRYKSCQILITAVASSTIATGTVLQQLPPAQTLTASSTDGFFVGQVVTGQTSNATGEVTATTSTTVTVQLKSIYTGFTSAEVVVSPTSRATLTGVATAVLQASVDWDEQAASSYRGWPGACLYDRSRLAMFDLPQVPEGIIWSAVSAYADFNVGADAGNAIFELVPGRKHVLYMLGGPDQFVFTDSSVYYIPISTSSPLKPGSVEFVSITSDGCGTVVPVSTGDSLLFSNTGRSRITAIMQTGQVTRPYLVQDVTEFCSHLIKSPICIATTTGDGDYPERYVYVVNSDGTMAVGRVTSSKKWVGWTPWDGAGLFRWASGLGAEMVVNVDYVGTGTVSLVESITDTQDMDGVVTLNSVIAPLAPANGYGPLWFWAGSTVDFTDGGRDIGNRSVDALGNIVALLGDDFTSPTIKAGRSWTSEFEPFVPHAVEGKNLGQTQRVRKLKQAAVAVLHSTGFEWGGRTIPAYQWGEEGGNAPTEREATYRFRNLGRSVDPRAVLSKSRPGSLSIVEVSLEVTV